MTPDPDTFEKYRDELLKSIAMHLPFLSRYFCKSMPSSWQKVVYTPPICITIRLPFVPRYFCSSIRVRGRWDTPKKRWISGPNRVEIRSKSGPNQVRGRGSEGSGPEEQASGKT